MPSRQSAEHPSPSRSSHRRWATAACSTATRCTPRATQPRQRTVRSSTTPSPTRPATVTDEPPFEDAIKKTCADGFAEALGLTRQQANLTIFAWAWYEPSPRDYALGARSYRCDLAATNTDGGEPVPLPAGELPLLEGEEVPDAYALCRTSKKHQRALHGAARLAGHRQLRGHRRGVSVRLRRSRSGPRTSAPTW